MAHRITEIRTVWFRNLQAAPI